MKSKFFLALLALLPASLATGLEIFDFDVLDALQEMLTSPTGWLMCVLICGCVLASGTADAALTTNSWINSGDGLWHVGLNWSLGVTPSNNQAAVLITNAATKTVIINSLSAGLSSVMTISNLTVRGFGAGTNTLFLNSSGTNVPLRILSGFTLGTNAVLGVTNSVLRVDGLSGGGFSVDGSATNLAGGQIISTNVSMILGNVSTSRGNFTILGGLLLASNVTVGSATGSQGTLTIAGGTNSLTSELLVGNLANATGAVWLTGGRLVVTNATTLIGESGIAQMTVSNGTWLGGFVTVGRLDGSHGTLTWAGGTNLLAGPLLSVGASLNATGTVWMTGGLVVATNTIMNIGIAGSGQMTVSNGIWLAGDVRVGQSSHGTLTIAGGSNAITGPLTVGGTGTGTVFVTGGQLVITNTPETVGTGSGFVVDGSVTLNNGSSITVHNVATIIGNRGSGSLTMFGGSMLVSNLLLGATNGASGTLTMQAGTLTGGLTVGSATNSTGTLRLLGGNVFSGLTVGDSFGSTGTVWMTGGLWLGSGTIANSSKNGQMIISNGTFIGRPTRVAQLSGSSGTLTIAGGTNDLAETQMVVGSGTGSTGTVWLLQGQLSTSNFIGAVIIVGNNSVGRMNVSNGVMHASNLTLGLLPGGSGTLTVAGGISTVLDALTLGNFACTATGVVDVVGGTLLVHAAGNAVLDVRSGSLNLNSGTLTIDQLVMTNGCGRFLKTGGTLSITSTNLAANLDADGDGIPNGYEQANGLDPFNPADAALDNDGDGFTNLQEFQAGTNPNDVNSTPFQITAIAKESNDIRVTWSTVPGITNVLQTTAGDGSGGYSTNNFTDIFTVTNTAAGTTNYLDVGGASATSTSRYYRVRLVP